MDLKSSIIFSASSGYYGQTMSEPVPDWVLGGVVDQLMGNENV